MKKKFSSQILLVNENIYTNQPEKIILLKLSIASGRLQKVFLSGMNIDLHSHPITTNT